MKMRFQCRQATTLISAMAMLLSGTAIGQFTNPRPMLRASDEYQALLLQRAYAKLERAAAEAHSSSSRIDDGQPRLAALYSGTAGCVCGNQLTEELWKIRGERLREWNERYPNSVTARVALASFPLRYGWFLRGSGYSNTVSPDAWKQFGSRAEAATHDDGIEQSGWGCEKGPGMVQAMLTSPRTAVAPRPIQCALRPSRAGTPDYLPIYFTGASYYSPKWGRLNARPRELHRARHRCDTLQDG
jgi:hypothetical protein